MSLKPAVFVTGTEKSGFSPHEEMYYGMSLAECPEPSIVVDRGLALHKVLRLLVLGLGGAGRNGLLSMYEP